ncbi:MAG: SDR family oxidoreductase [Burkholderiales bacterium]|nr:SDR family oxidoreductase [Burkholderiales bacterium]
MPDTPERPLQGRVALITGANTGIGRAIAHELAHRGAQVFIACRSEQRAQAALAEIRAAHPRAPAAQCLPLDLGDLASVRRCAQQFLALGQPLHLLINNAGLAGQRGLSASGFERAFGVNHLGHFLLTQCLLPCLRASAPARIVTVSSNAHYRARGIPWEALRRPTRTLTGVPEYAVSKLCNVLFSAELGRRLAGSGVTTHAAHPGVVATEVWRAVPMPLRWLIKRGMISPEAGAQTPLHCATAESAGQETGLYYDRCRTRPPSLLATDTTLAAELWQRSESWVA